jgi:RimJ/RimL family protein N-acetyltransferase
MELLSLDRNELIRIAANWLGEERNYRWLDFGGGVQRLEPSALKIMSQRDSHVLRLFTADDDDQRPIGIVALSNIDQAFRTGTLWIVLGERQYSSKGYAYRACTAILKYGFDTLRLRAINAWAVECNYASLRTLKKMNFRLIGRQRQCHYLDGRAFDRLWFDLLANEHAETAT